MPALVRPVRTEQEWSLNLSTTTGIVPEWVCIFRSPSPPTCYGASSGGHNPHLALSLFALDLSFLFSSHCLLQITELCETPNSSELLQEKLPICV